RGVERGEDVFCRDRRFAIVQFDDDARHALLAKWDQHASSYDGSGVRGDTVGKDHVERNRNGDVAEFGHWIQRIAVRRDSGFIDKESSFALWTAEGGCPHMRCAYSAGFLGGSRSRYFMTICKSFQASPF